MAASLVRCASISSAFPFLFFFSPPFRFGQASLTFDNLLFRSWEDPKRSRREANTVGEPPDKTAPNELGIDWGNSPLEVVQWTADELLRDMEARVYDEGFVPSAVGF